MVFNKLNTGKIVMILISIVIVGVLIKEFTHKVDAFSHSSVTPEINDSNSPISSEMPTLTISPKPVLSDENDETLKKITEQMEKDREQQRRIKDLKMQREETDLELEEQKTLSELNKLKKDSIGSVNEGSSAYDYNMNIKVVYLGGTDVQKEAILSINGANYSVKVKDRPLQNIEVQSITNNDITVRFLTPENHVSVYQFKSE